MNTAGTSMIERFGRGAQMHNPYYEEWQRVRGRSKRLGWLFSKNLHLIENLVGDQHDIDDARAVIGKINDFIHLYTRRFAWAIPSTLAIEIVSAYSPLVEIGAGTGYWAWLLRQNGADVLA